MAQEFENDRRFPQADREALISLGLYAVYFLWWYLTAYGFGNDDPNNYTYILGFPAWFFYSCIAGYPIITVLLGLAVHFFFKNMPIAAEEDKEKGQNNEQ